MGLKWINCCLIDELKIEFVGESGLIVVYP